MGRGRQIRPRRARAPIPCGPTESLPGGIRTKRASGRENNFSDVASTRDKAGTYWGLSEGISGRKESESVEYKNLVYRIYRKTLENPVRCCTRGLMNIRGYVRNHFVRVAFPLIKATTALKKNANRHGDNQ